MEKIAVKTRKQKEVVDITDRVESALARPESIERAGHEVRSGICHLFLTHTTAALTTADLDPGTDLDMLDAFEAMVPPYQSEARDGAARTIRYRHPHDPSHVPDHILSSLIGTSLSVPVKDGKLVLGTWQRIVLIEFDGPRDRELYFLFQ